MKRHYPVFWIVSYEKGWSQEELAERVGVTRNTLSKWERGIVAPYPLHVHRLCSLLGKTAAELDLEKTLGETIQEQTTKEEIQPSVRDVPLQPETSLSQDIQEIMIKIGKDTMDPLRRATIAGPLSLINGTTAPLEWWEHLAYPQPLPMKIEEFNYFQQLVENVWKLCNAGEWEVAEQVLSGFLPDAVRLAPKQKEVEPTTRSTECL